MIQTTPYNSIPTGLDSFTQANSPLLKQNIENILKEAFKATFLYGAGEDGEDIAKAFAQTAASPLADTIDDYINKAIKSQMIQIVPKTLMAGTFPVTGQMSTLLSDIIIN